MTQYQADIDDAQELIAESGFDIVIQRKTDANTTTYSESDFGTATFSGETVNFGSGDLTTAVSEGDSISFRDVANFGNRGPFEVVGVTATSVTIDGSLTDAIEDQYYMDIESDGASYANDVGVPLPPKSATGQSFEQDFRDGTLQISKAKDIIISAKALEFNPRPGDKIQLGNSTWDSSKESWQIHGIGAIAPDNAPIVWQGIITKG